MSDTENGTLKQMANVVLKAFEPLKYAFEDADNFSILLEHFGWWVEGNSVPNNLLGNFSGLVSSVDQLIAKVQELMDAEGDSEWSKYLELATIISEIVLEIEQISNISWTDLPAPLNEQDLKEILTGLVDYVVVSNLISDYPFIYSMMKLIGIIEETELKYDPATSTRIDYLQQKINWSNLETLFSNPAGLGKAVYAWNDSANPFNYMKALRNIRDCVTALEVGAGIQTPDPSFKNHYYGEPTPWEQVPNCLKIHLFEGYDPQLDGWAEIGLVIFPIPATNGSNIPAGLAITPYMEGSISQTFQLSPNWKLTLTGEFATGTDVGIEFLPDTVKILKDFANNINAKAKVEIAGKFDEPLILFGTSTGTRFQVGAFKVGLEIDCSGIDLDKIDFAVELSLDEAAIVIQAGEGDGFLQKLLPSDPIILDFNLTIGLSRKRGLYFKGGAGIEFTIHVDQSIGPITLTTIDIKLALDDSGKITLVAAASAQAVLGPVQASVTKIGLKTLIELGKSGVFGNADLSLGFKPPSGIGLNIDASVVVGGGFLEIEDGNYAGILHLEIQEIVTVTVIGILTTKIPGGSPKFSLKLIGMVEFPPIQLGMGFILTGIGLAVAIECTMNTEALRDSVYSGSLTSLMFPPDPIKNAQKIIADLKSFFPPKEGAFVFGAMVKLGWGGATTLVTASVGIFIEIDNGSLSRIALAAIAVIALPTKDDLVLLIQLQMIGIIDFNECTFSLDASLFGSRLLTFNLGGDMALRCCWGENSRFAFSAGGFFPGYKPPAGFPALRRLSITIGSDNPMIGLFLYFAAAENSIQLGAALLFHFQMDITFVGLVEVDGQFGFDALFKFNPFYFEANMYASLELKINGDPKLTVSVGLYLSGPNNYHAKGYAKFKILGFGASVDFDKTFGDKQDELPKPVLSPWAALDNELQSPKNWSIIPPNPGYNVVLFREGIEELYLDNAGSLQFRQRAVPLRFRLQKFGEAAIPDGENFFDLEWATSGGSEEVQDGFAPGQFEYLSDQEKISAPPFEKMKSGIVFSGGGSQISAKRYGKPVGYETKVITAPDIPPTPVTTQSVMAPAALQDWQQMAGERYHHRYGEEPANVPQAKIRVKEQQFTLVTADGENGKFRRAGDQDSGKAVENYTYARTRQIQKEQGKEGTEIMNTAKADSVA